MDLRVDIKLRCWCCPAAPAIFMSKTWLAQTVKLRFTYLSRTKSKIRES